MRTNTAPIGREALLAEANNIIRQHEDYLHGMIATDVEQKNGVLVFRGEYFFGCRRIAHRQNHRGI